MAYLSPRISAAGTRVPATSRKTSRKPKTFRPQTTGGGDAGSSGSPQENPREQGEAERRPCRSRTAPVIKLAAASVRSAMRRSREARAARRNPAASFRRDDSAADGRPSDGGQAPSRSRRTCRRQPTRRESPSQLTNVPETRTCGRFTASRQQPARLNAAGLFTAFYGSDRQPLPSDCNPARRAGNTSEHTPSVCFHRQKRASALLNCQMLFMTLLYMDN